MRPFRRRAMRTAAAGLALAASRAASAPPTVRVGLTPVFLDDRVRLLRRWRDYLGDSLGSAVEFVQRGTYAQVLDALRASQIDFAWICGYPYVLHQAELRLVAVPQWRGRPVYQSYLLAGAESPLRSLAELRGRTFAYSDPLSNSGFLYVQHLLRAQGLDPGRFFGRTFFTHSHRHVVEAVAAGLADAGAVDGYVWETLVELHPGLAGRTQVLHRSPEFGFPPIVAAAKTAPEQVRRFRAALVEMTTDPAGRSVLAELRLDRFVAGDPALFQGIAEMARWHGRPA